jgi:hypothetical protein
VVSRVEVLPRAKNSKDVSRAIVLLLTENSFGYADGISQPFVEGVGDVTAGRTRFTPGVIVYKSPGDSVNTRPPWIRDGSIMAF